MTSSPFAADLARYGPGSPGGGPPSRRASRRYCRLLAGSHYENFTVASLLLPRGLRQHFCNLYAYCRWADDLADETGDPQRGLELLDWWDRQVHECYAGRASHPVFIALGETIERFGLPPQPLVDLLVAFRQDQTLHRYETFPQLLSYCRYSANPVGRLVLYLGECFSAERAELSDAICTGLQLANFCQDVARDWDRGRIYLPQCECRRFGYDEARFAARQADDSFRRLLAVVVAEAEGWLRRGLPLVAAVPEQLKLPIALFARGGLAILAAIRRQDYDVWTNRPTVPRLEKLWLMADSWWRLRRGTLLEANS